MEKHGGMHISCPKLFAAECYAWLTAKCVIEECLRLGSASGFAPTNAMELPSKFLENASLLIGNNQGVDGMDFFHSPVVIVENQSGSECCDSFQYNFLCAFQSFLQFRPPERRLPISP